MTEKTCADCLKSKPHSEFYKRKGSLRPFCKACWSIRNAEYRAAADPIARARYNTAYYEENKASFWARNIFATYGITAEDYYSLLVAQNESCAVCESTVPGGGRTYFCIDHDHKTGAVRGLLCNTCNRAIGLFREDPAILNKAIDYLSRSERQS